MVYESWLLVESVRTARGPRQRVVATVGKLPGLDEEARVGWEEIGRILDGRAHQQDFFRSREPEAPPWATVDVSRVRVERMRGFGEVYLGLALWRRLGLDGFFNEAMEEGREEIPWATMACLLALARFCAPSSELKIAESWYAKTALEDLLGVPVEKVNDDRLYRGLDALLPKREELFKHLTAPRPTSSSASSRWPCGELCSNGCPRAAWAWARENSSKKWPRFTPMISIPPSSQLRKTS